VQRNLSMRSCSVPWFKIQNIFVCIYRLVGIIVEKVET